MSLTKDGGGGEGADPEVREGDVSDLLGGAGDADDPGPRDQQKEADGGARGHGGKDGRRHDARGGGDGLGAGFVWVAVVELRGDA